MATTIVTKSGSGAPAASDLVAGELAVDLTNKRLYTEDSSAAIIELGTNPSGNVTFGDNGKAIFGDGSDLQIYHDGSHARLREITGDFRIQTTSSGVNALVAKQNAEVEITYAGATKLATTSTGIDVTGTATMDGLTVVGETTSSNGTYGTKLTYSNSQQSGIIDTFGNHNLEFRTNNDRAMNIAANGDISFYEDTGTTPKLVWDASAEMLTTSGLTVDGAADATVRVEATSGNDASLFLTEAGTGNVGAQLVYDGGDNKLHFKVGNNTDLTRMVIERDTGNVGIGTSSPSSSAGWGTLLEVSGATNAGIKLTETDTTNGDYSLGVTAGTFRIWDETASAFRLTLDGSGNVGIGTSTPSTSLDVVRAGVQPLRLQSTSGTEVAINMVNTGGNVQLEAHSGNFNIDADAVGIGTSSPASALEVNGDIGIGRVSGGYTFRETVGGNERASLKSNANNELLFSVSASTEAMRIDSSGNLLVGKTTQGTSTIGAELGSTGWVAASRDGNTAAFLNRSTSDGEIVRLTKDGTSVGSIGTVVDFLTIGTGDSGLLFNSSDDAVQPWNLTTNAARDAAIDLGRSSHRFKDLHLSGRAYINDGVKIDSGSGIYFGQDGNAANKLDDYEEGTWTVTSGIGLTITTAVYTKVGRVVHLIADITFASGSSSSADATLTLPFSNFTTYSSGSLNYTTHSGTPAISVAGDSLKFREAVGGATLSYNAVSGHRFIFHATYFAA